MSIRQFLWASGLSACLLPAQAQVPSPAQAPASASAHVPAIAPVSLAQALQATRDNLDVALARQALAGARADIVSADRAPLPVLSARFSQMDAQNGLGNGHILTEKRIDKALGIDWTWERGDKRTLRTRAAHHAADAAQADLDDVRLQQQLGAQAAFHDLLAAQQRQHEVVQIAHGAAELARSARQRLQAGDLSAQDTARLEIEAERAHADVRQAELDRQRTALVLWQITGLATPADQLRVQAEAPPNAPADILAADLDRLLASRADVRAAQARVQAAQALLEGSSALRQSDITWGTSYDHYPGTSTALMEVRMQMPLQWGYAYQGEIARAGAQLSLAEQARDKVLRQARSELQRLQQEVHHTAQRRASYAQDILPRARQVAATAERAYARGALSLTDLLDARRTLRTTLIEALTTHIDHAKAVTAWQLRTQAPAESSAPDTGARSGDTH